MESTEILKITLFFIFHLFIYFFIIIIIFQYLLIHVIKRYC